MKIQSHLYVAYLLRMWQAEKAGRLVWRASLESPQTGKVLFFDSLPHLFQFLEKGGGVLGGNSSPPEEDEDKDPPV